MANTEGCVHYIIAKDIKDYIEKKIFMLEDGFRIHLTKRKSSISTNSKRKSRLTTMRCPSL